MQYSGEYGGVVKREIKNAGGKRWIAGAILKPEHVETWPLANRQALHTAGYVDWYGPPVQAEVEAREAGGPASERRPSRVSDEKKSTTRRTRK